MEPSTFFEHLKPSRPPSDEDIDGSAGPDPEDDQAHILHLGLEAQKKLAQSEEPPGPDDESAGLVWGHFRILERLGHGGSGQIFKALYTSKNCVVALKVLPQKEYRREVQAGMRLNHPNIVTAYDAYEIDGLHFLVLEYVEGSTLTELVKAQGPLPVPFACELICQAAEALQYAHEQGVVHRDINPSNLLLAQPTGAAASPEPDAAPAAVPLPAVPLVKVLDFGLARLRDAGPAGAKGAPLTDADKLAGTPDFVSPEHAHDMDSVDIRSDLYSLGCTFYYALTGQAPFSGSVLEKLSKHLLKEPEPVEQLRPDVPAGVAAIIRRLMAKDPKDRFQTPARLLKALRPWCDPDHVDDGTALAWDDADDGAVLEVENAEATAAEDEAESDHESRQPAEPAALVPGRRSSRGGVWAHLLLFFGLAAGLGTLLLVVDRYVHPILTTVTLGAMQAWYWLTNELGVPPWLVVAVPLAGLLVLFFARTTRT
jgi:serine/threonine protein kinase